MNRRKLHLLAKWSVRLFKELEKFVTEHYATATFVGGWRNIEWIFCRCGGQFELDRWAAHIQNPTKKGLEAQLG